MAFKIGGTEVIDDSGEFAGEFGGLVVNNKLVFCDPRLSPVQGTVSGYTSGGFVPNVNTIDKFPFASDGNATDVGNLTQARFFVVGQSSDAYGYTSGGFAPPQVNTIDKFPFASDGNATDVGDLTQARHSAAGQQSGGNA